jgi:apolipoprotein N-acyltransferase
MNYYLTQENRTIIAEMPTKGVRTLYSQWGDWFAYGCLLLLSVEAGLAVWDTAKKARGG